MVYLFSSQKTYVLSNPSWSLVLFCSAFYCYFSKQHFTKDNNEKKSHGRTKETTLYLRLKTCWKFPQKREYQTSTSLRGSSLFWARRENSRESSTRKETRVRGAGWEARSLATSFAFWQAKLQQLSCALFIFMTISIDRGTLTLFAVYNLYWLLPYFHFHSDLERSEIIASNKSLNQRGSSWK